MVIIIIIIIIIIMIMGRTQVLWTCTGRNKMLPPSTRLPVMGEIAGVNTIYSS